MEGVSREGGGDKAQPPAKGLSPCTDPRMHSAGSLGVQGWGSLPLLWSSVLPVGEECPVNGPSREARGVSPRYYTGRGLFLAVSGPMPWAQGEKT